MTDHSWFREFCENTTIHCMQYIVMKHRSLIEKIYWTITFLFMIWLTIYTAIVVIDVWMNNQTVMYIDNHESPIKEIPFPSIKICPSYHLRKNVWERHMNTNSSYWEHLQQYYSDICFFRGSVTKSMKRPLKYYDYDSIKNVVKDSAISCAEIMQSVVWQNYTIPNFCNYVQPVLSVLGLCFVINMMPMYQLLNDEYYQRYTNFFWKNNTYLSTEKTKWNLDDGYASYPVNSLLVDIIPARTNGFSYYHRLRLSLHTLDDEFLNCSREGLVNDFFLITFSNPAEYDSLNSRSFIVPDTYTKVQITPLVKRINSDIERLSPSVKKCYMHNERKLSIFQHYTEKNCNYECIVNKTVSACGCVSFFDAYLVRTNGDKTICGPTKKDCMIEAKKATYLQESLICNCLPTCNVIEYDASRSSHYDDWTYMKTTKLENNKARGATVEIVFKHPHFTAYKSTSFLNINNLISITGGVLGLLLGINAVNAFEILYIIIRMFRYYIVQIFFNN